jgi:hypothetical protein
MVKLGMMQVIVAVVSLLGAAFADAAVIGPVYPAPGGNQFSGSGSAGDPGGRTNSYSNFDTSAFSELYWGAWSGSPPAAALDGSLDSMTFTGAAGTVATWNGTTSWVNPMTNVLVMNVPTQLTITIAGLGPNPWVSFAAVNGSDPSGVGAVVDNSLGANFSATLAFFANVGSGWQPLNIIDQRPNPSGQTRSSFSGGFYSAAPVPLPAAAWLLLSGLMGVIFAGKRRSAG